MAADSRLLARIRSRLFALLDTRHGVLGLSLMLALAVWLTLGAATAPWITAFEERAGDWVWRLSAEKADERRLIVIDIDERSLAEVGPWPWPRATQARLIEALAQAGVRQQIFDIVFSEATPDDPRLVRALEQHQPVLSQVFALEQGGSPSSGQPAGALDWSTCPPPFGQAQGYIANQALFGPASSSPNGHTGHITPRIAADGVVRHQPAVICWADKSYPALALAALMQGTDEKTLNLQRGGWLDAPWLLTGGNQTLGRIPLSERGDLRVSWHLSPGSFISLSASDVLAGRLNASLPANLLSGAWVLVGSSAFGIKDTIATPFDGSSAGLQAHAQIITALIDARTPYTPRIAPWAQLLAMLAGSWLLYGFSADAKAGRGQHARSALRLRFPSYLLPLAALLYSTLIWLAHAAMLAYLAVWIGWVSPVIFIMLAGLSMGILSHAKSRLDRDRLYTHLSSYLPAPVAASLALQSPSGAIKASTLEVSVLIADIRNFSAYCEARPPEESAAVLHAFFSAATRVVQAHGGIIEAFQGDAVVAVWNTSDTPTNTIHHAHHALQAAVELQTVVQDILPDPAPGGLEPLSLGIGVETGLAMAGSFGLASRRTHMVMGRTVTIASRLVGMTADLSHPILVGEGLASRLGGAGLESMGTFILDGMRVPHHVYAYPLVRALRLY